MEHIAAEIVKEKTQAGENTLSQFKGKPLPFSIGYSSNEKVKILASDLVQFQKEKHLSDKTTIDMGAFINKKMKRRVVEGGLAAKIVEVNRSLEPFFQGVDLLFENSAGNFVEEHAILVTNISDFALHMIQQWGFDIFQTVAVVGVDKGGEHLKITLSLVPMNMEPVEKQKYSGVNRIFLVGCFPGIETHHNISVLFKKIHIWDLKGFFAVDFKVKNMICGVQPHSCTYPCCNCTASKSDFENLGEPRTVATLAKSFEAFIADGGDKKKAPKHHSVVNQPLLLESMDEMKECNQPLIDFFSPSELHIMLGIVNHIYKAMKERWDTEVDGWVKVSLSRRSNYHGGSFEGGQCKKLLEHLNFFEDNLGNPRVPEMMPFLQVLKLFNSIRKACFSSEKADPFYKDFIEKFKKAFVELNLDTDTSILPKVHDLFFHVSEFVEKYPDIPIGQVCEQTSESLHSRFDKFRQTRMIKNKDHPNYKTRFFNCVVAFNGKQSF